MPLRAVLFDAGNTLLFLDHPRMAAAVGAALGLPLTGPALAAGAAPRRPRDGGRRGSTTAQRATAYLEALFLEAGVPAERLPEVRSCLATLHVRAASLERHRGRHARRPRPGFADAGLKLGVVSNSDGRVAEALEAAGLRGYFDVVVDSALAGVEKPDPAIFRAALDVLDVPPAEALYLGDLYDVDVLGRRTPRASRPSCSCRPAPRGRRGVRPSARSRSWPTTCSRRDWPHDGCAPYGSGPRGRCLARSGCSSPSRGSTATTGARRSSPRRSATREWRSSTPGCTRRPR